MSAHTGPLQSWVYLDTESTRRLVQLPASAEQTALWLDQLQQLRRQGVDALVVPIHWRWIAPFAPEQANEAASWAGYQRLFTQIHSQGLKIVAEVAFVASGLNQPSALTLLPDWLWGQLQQALPDHFPIDSLKYLDQYGRDTIAALSLWAKEVTLPFYRQFLQGMALHLSSQAGAVQQILFGLGPDGEWRYPWLGRYEPGEPARVLPCFSELALADLHRTQLLRHGSELAWCQHWGYPTDRGVSHVADRRQLLLWLLEQPDGPAWQEFFAWYRGSLQEYGCQILALARQTFTQPWRIKLGLRLCGSLPRLSETVPLPPGLIAGLQGPGASADPAPLLAGLKAQLGTAELTLLLPGVAPAHGQPASPLVQAWIAAAEAQGIALMAECRAAEALQDHPQWDRLIQAVLRQGPFRGWLLGDLPSLMASAEQGQSRLRQLARLKHAQGQVPQLASKQFRVMGPLHLKVANQRQMVEEEDWLSFAQQLRQLRRLGVTAVSTDLWWGLVEGRQPGQFDWSYYDRLVAVLAEQEMHWVPILSFHQAGGNVNDDYMQTIPLWLWGILLQRHPELESVRDLQYVSETGDASMEYVSLWADPYVTPFYLNFMTAFAAHYADRAGMIDEINISLGPAGELRFPSYNAHDWGNYPNRGTLQCYSPLAQQDWRRHLQTKFGTVEALNYAFGSQYRRLEAVPMPLADSLFDNKQYVYSAWGREFLSWYQGSLIRHGRQILEGALALFGDSPLKAVPIGIKIPGIHWEISDPASPRVAEITAGLIAPHPALGPHNQREYVRLLEGLIAPEHRGRVVVHFTCLEMINKDYEGYSRAADLVSWFADAAHEVGVSLMGENALAGELYGEQGWQQIAGALGRNPGYDGITFLRMQNFFDDNKLPRERLAWLINQFQ
ncbi:family 14 glycosylhydrolase [Pseudaeromonas sp. ZJS20]|uniref:family 14 glycosylhydrolase n=1 Tax=Pseudaeromonas aegiceratis TaxID=3153928 RepID=UPI00390C87ED